MKKLILLVIAFSLMLSCAYAENLAGMTIDDLVALRNAINAEIAGRPEWKQVTVPAGQWIIGEDIPAGYYSITALDKIAIVEAAPSGSPHDDFYHVISAGGNVGKVLFVEGSIFKTNAPIILAPPLGLDF